MAVAAEGVRSVWVPGGPGKEQQPWASCWNVFLGIACRGVRCRGRGLGSLLDCTIVQVEVACDERGGLAVRLVQQRLVPLKVAHHLLKARALIEAVRPKRLHLFTVAQLRPPPVPRPPV